MEINHPISSNTCSLKPTADFRLEHDVYSEYRLQHMHAIYLIIAVSLSLICFFVMDQMVPCGRKSNYVMDGIVPAK
jgi:hypothetical protein